MTASLPNLGRITVSTAAKKIINNSGDSTHPCRSPCFVSNKSEDMPSSDRTHALNPIMELLDDCYHMQWYSDESEHLPQKSAVDGVVSLLEINEAHQE